MVPRCFFRRLCDAAAFPMAFSATCFLAVLPRGYALPSGAHVAAGNIAITQAGGVMSINQASRTAIVNWQQFNIAPHERVQILQPGADAAMLARVVGNDPSQLLGSLQADGKLFLINRNGVVVGKDARIDTAAFLASTLDVADADFLAGGALDFKGESAAGIVNLGTITAREGNVLLFAHTVQNTGEISAPKGTAGLGAGTEVYLASPDDSTFTIKLNLPSTTEKTGVENSGTIAGAQAELKAAGGSIYNLAVNQSGVVRATGIERLPDGRVMLTAAGGNVAVNGIVSARGADGAGGEILVGGDYQGKNPAVANAGRTYVGPDAKLDAGDATATEGKVVVWADGVTRFDGHIETGRGGAVEVSGKRSLGFNGSVATHGGTLLLDPDDITIVAGSGSAPTGLADGNWFTSEDPGAQTLGADTLASLLFNNRVFLQAANSVTVNAPVVVAAGGAAGVELALEAPIIALNQSISLAAVADGGIHLNGGASLVSAAGATLAADTVQVRTFPVVSLNGPVIAALFIYGSLGSPTSFTATNPANGIAKFLANTDTADPQAVTFANNVAVHSNTAMQVQALIGGANNVIFSSAGDLTLLGSDLNGPGTVIATSGATKLASTGGVLINRAGAGILTGAGRKLLYTSTTVSGSGFDLGGLAGYTRFSGVIFPNDPQTGVNQVLYRADGLLTIAADAKSKTYGGADPTFTATYTGGTAAELSTLPSFSIQQGAHVNAGTYTIVPAGAADDYYDLAYQNGTLTINPATLTYAANPASRTTVASDPSFSGTITGFVNGDTPQTATAGTLTFATTATSASPAGSYPINGSGLTALNNNYIFAQAPGNATAFSITQAGLLTIAANSFTKTYGESDPTFTATYTGGTAANLTTLPSFSILQGAHVNTGTYTIVPSGAASATHALSYQNGTLTINPATLTYVANPATRTTIGADPAFSGHVTGFVAGDTLASATTGTLAFTTTATASSPAGGYALNGSGLTANNGNYIFAQAPGNATAFTLTAGGLLTITANDFIKLYGKPDPTFTASYAGGTAADLTRLPSFSILQGAHTNVGTYTIVPSGAVSPTHAIDYVNGTLRIDPVTLTYVAAPASRFYGDANPAFGGTVTGFVAGDTLASATTGRLTFTSSATTTSNTGEYAILGGGLTANFGNYVFQDALANFSALTINRAPLTVTFADATRTYGAANPEFVPTFTGFRNGDTAAMLTGFAWGTTATAASPVGDYAIGASGTSGVPNYAITITPATLSITPATLTYVADAASRIYRATNPLFSGTVTGLVNGETLASATTGTLAWTSPATTISNAGAYAVNGSGLTANHGNYVFAQAPTNATALTVGRAPLTLEGRTLTAVYGGAIPALGYTLSGPHGTPEAAELAGINIALGEDFVTGTPAGTYSFDVTVSGTAQNYEIASTVPGKLTIAPAPVTLHGEHVTTYFGDPIPTPGYSVTGLVGTDTAAVLSGVKLGREFPAGPSPGNYEIGFINTGTAQNYVVTEVVNGSVTVARRPLTITADDLTTLTGAIPPLTSTMTGTTVAGAPPFEVRYQVYQRSVKDGIPTLTPVGLSSRTPAGDYVIRPVLEFDHVATGHPEAVYDISLVDGTLSLKMSPLDFTKLDASTVTNVGDLIIGDTTKLNFSGKTLVLPDSPSKISVDYMTKPGDWVKPDLMPAALATVSKVWYLKSFMADYGIDQMVTPEQQQLALTLNRDRNLLQDAKLFADDPDARIALAAFLTTEMLLSVDNARSQGTEYSPPAARVPVTTRISVLLAQARSEKLHALLKEMDAQGPQHVALVTMAYGVPGELERLTDLARNPTNGGLTNLNTASPQTRQELFAATLQMVNETYAQGPAGL